jgi:hypothetical protein
MKYFHQFSISLLILGIAGSLFAQPHSQKGEEQHKKFREETRAFVEKEVVPVLSEARQKLDPKMSAEDRAEVGKLRNELAAQREAQHKLHQQNRPARGEEPSEAQRAARQADMKAKRLLMTRAWAIADKYETDIEALQAALRPQADSWKESLQELHEAHRPESVKPKEGERKEHGKGMREHRGHKKGGHHAHGPKGPRGPKLLHSLESPVGFLLFDPANPFPKAEEAREISLEAFPNPASSSTTLSYELQTPGMVGIQLLDTQGQVIQDLYRGKAEAGVNSQLISLEGLEKGVYFIRLESKQGVASKKVVVE